MKKLTTFLLLITCLIVFSSAKTTPKGETSGKQSIPSLYKKRHTKQNKLIDDAFLVPKKKKKECVPPPLITAAQESKGFIVLDPGHGGDDFGTHSSSKPRYHEKSLNLSTSFLVKTYLEQLGYKIVMTRKDDRFISLERRAELANELTPNIFVSIHYNSAPSKEAYGIEVFYYRTDEDKERTAESKKLASSILKAVIGETKAKSRGVKHGNFAVIRHTKMPAILIEAGFLTNDDEMQKIKDPAYMKKLAWGIAQGIDNFVSK